MLTFHGKASMIAVVFPYLGLGANIKKIYDLTESCFERHQQTLHFISYIHKST